MKSKVFQFELWLMARWTQMEDTSLLNLRKKRWISLFLGVYWLCFDEEVPLSLQLLKWSHFIVAYDYTRIYMKFTRNLVYTKWILLIQSMLLEDRFEEKCLTRRLAGIDDVDTVRGHEAALRFGIATDVGPALDAAQRAQDQVVVVAHRLAATACKLKLIVKKMLPVQE